MCEVSDKKKSRKNDLLSSGNLKKKIPIFRKFCEFFQIFLKKSQMFQNSANLFVLKFKCAKFQTKKNSRKIPKIFENFNFFLIFLKKSQMFQNSANLIALKFKFAKFQTKKNVEKMTSWVVGIWKKKSQFFESFADIFLIFLKKSQMFQNSGNLFVLELKCAKFRTKQNFSKNPKKFPKISIFFEIS